MFATAEYRCSGMGVDDIPRLQRFFEENPEYHLAVEGRKPPADAASEEFTSLPPPEFGYDRRWILDFSAPEGEMIGMANVVSNLLAPGVGHVGLFIVATRLHGTGAAIGMYRGLESWMHGNGARWLRLGVVRGNTRAERFWEKMGFVEVRRRLGVQMGGLTHDLRVMVKPMPCENVAEYLSRVARDRPESP